MHQDRQGSGRNLGKHRKNTRVAALANTQEETIGRVGKYVWHVQANILTMSMLTCWFTDIDIVIPTEIWRSNNPSKPQQATSYTDIWHSFRSWSKIPRNPMWRFSSAIQVWCFCFFRFKTSVPLIRVFRWISKLLPVQLYFNTDFFCK